MIPDPTLDFDGLIVGHSSVVEVSIGQIVEGGKVGGHDGRIEVHYSDRVLFRYVCDGLWHCYVVAESGKGTYVGEGGALSIKVELELLRVGSGDECPDY